MRLSKEPASALDLDAKVAFLARPDAYPGSPPRVAVVRTHMSVVFLAGAEVFKLKRPVRQDVLDLRTLDARRRNCEAEVRLNRRLAPGVYRGIVPLVLGDDGGLRLGPAGGSVVDWLVRMRRLPEERMLDLRLREGRLDGEDLDRVALALARFYRAQPPVREDPARYVRRLAQEVRADRAQLLAPRYGTPAPATTAIAERLLRFLADERDLLEHRAAARFLVEGHGDLRPEHVAVGEPPVVIDCLEFDRRLRILDPADELSFLALECERLGAPAAGSRLLAVYRKATGDDAPSRLLAFHRRFRALRRAKIAAWHLDDPDVANPGRWRRRTAEYLDLAGEDDVAWLHGA